MNKIRWQCVRIAVFFVLVNMRCPRCKNEDMRYFAYDKGIWYCRRCIAFSRINVGDHIHPAVLSHRTWKGKPKMDYQLTKHQTDVSQKVLFNLKQGKDVFVYASTGARQNRDHF